MMISRSPTFILHLVLWSAGNRIAKRPASDLYSFPPRLSRRLFDDRADYDGRLFLLLRFAADAASIMKTTEEVRMKFGKQNVLSSKRTAVYLVKAIYV